MLPNSQFEKISCIGWIVRKGIVPYCQVMDGVVFGPADKTVLVIDDDERFLKVVAEMLKLFGYHVIEAAGWRMQSTGLNAMPNRSIWCSRTCRCQGWMDRLYERDSVPRNRICPWF